MSKVKAAKNAQEFYEQMSDELSKLSVELRSDDYLSRKIHGWALDKFKNGSCGTMEEAFAEAFAAHFAIRGRE